jgi:hypothetical protein
MITGKRLQEGRSQQEAFVMAATRPAPSVALVAPELSPEVVALIDRALQWDPRNRFQNAAEMREAIARVLGGPEAAPEPVAEAPKHGKAQLLAALAETADSEEAARELTPEEAARVAELQEIFTRMERGLNAVRQYSWDHKVAVGHMQTIHELLSAFLERAGGAIRWEVKPHSFTFKGAVLWEPLHPFDEIPYNLFASGFRSFAITAGVTLEEISTLLDLMRRDPLRDFSPEDDLATAFWEKQLEHVQYEVVSSFLTVGASEEMDQEYEELLEASADAVEKGAGSRRAGADLDAEPLSLEEKAAMLAARQVALRAGRAANAAKLDDRTRSLIAAALDMPEAEWEARYVKVLAHAAEDALTHGNLALVSTPLKVDLHEGSAGRTLDRSLGRTMAVLGALLSRAGPQARSELARDLVDAETLALVLRELARAVPDGEREQVARCAPMLSELLAFAGSEHFDTVLAALARTDVEPIRDALLRYLEPHASGREERIGELLRDADLVKGRTILGLLGRLGTEAAARALRAAEESVFPELRVEAVALRARASSEGLKDELSRLLADSDPGVRVAAMRTLAKNKVLEAGPVLVQTISDPGFHRLDYKEREQAFECLWELSPVRAESLALDVAVKSGMLTRESVDDTRILAIQVLERLATKREVVTELEKASGKWTNSQPVRDAAAVAAKALRRRLGAR